jgi:hypothetical protein
MVAPVHGGDAFIHGYAKALRKRRGLIHPRGARRAGHDTEIDEGDDEETDERG